MFGLALGFSHAVEKLFHLLWHESFFFFFFSDGKISLQEMISAVQRLKDAPSEAKCQRIAEMLDEDHDGALDLVDVGTVSKNY